MISAVGRGMCSLPMVVSACSTAGTSVDGGADSLALDRSSTESSILDGAIMSCADVVAYPVQAPPQSLVPQGKPCAAPLSTCEMSAQAPCPPGEVGGAVNEWECACKKAHWACVITSQGLSKCVRTPDASSDVGGAGADAATG